MSAINFANAILFFLAIAISILNTIIDQLVLLTQSSSTSHDNPGSRGSDLLFAVKPRKVMALTKQALGMLMREG